jgi:hypothetical protein
MQPKTDGQKPNGKQGGVLYSHSGNPLQSEINDDEAAGRALRKSLI